MKRKLYLLTSLAVTGLVMTGLASCGGGEPEAVKYLGTSEKPKVTINLSDDFVKWADDPTYFSAYLAKTGGENPQFVSTKSGALLASGSVTSLYAYDAPKEATFGVTVLDAQGNEATGFVVSNDGKLTAPSVAEKTDYTVYLYALTKTTDATTNVSTDLNFRDALAVSVVPSEQYPGTNVEYFDYTSIDSTQRSKVSGQIEKNLYDDGLAPINILDDGGYGLYSDRIDTQFLKSNTYVPGYGYGVLDYGVATKDLAGEQTPAYKRYYHALYDIKGDEGKFNYLNSNSNTVNTLYNYVSAGYYTQLVNSDSTGIEYVGVLARDDAPIAVEADASGASTKWKIRLKVGGDTADESKGVTPGIAFRTGSTNPTFSKYNNRNITIDDYLTTVKLLAMKSVGYYRGSEQAGEETLNRQIKGFAEFYNDSENMTTLPSNEEFSKAVGVSVDKSDNSITFEFNGKIAPDYAEYQLNGLWGNPMCEDFLKDLGGGDVIKGAKAYGANSETLSPLDTTLSVGPYYLSTYESKVTIAFAKNENWPLKKDKHNRDINQWPGVHLSVRDLSTDPNTTIKAFEGNLVDYSNITTEYYSKYASDPRRRKEEGAGFVGGIFVNTWDKQFHETIASGSGESWTVKPAMSNNNFYKGLQVGIDRNALGDRYHYNPTAVIQEPIAKINPKVAAPFNESDDHTEAVTYAFGDSLNTENFAEWKNNAADYFELAIEEELESGHYKLGTTANPTQVTFTVAGVQNAKNLIDRFNAMKANWASAFESAVLSHQNSEGVNDWAKDNKPLITLNATMEEVPNTDDTVLQKTVIYDGVKVGKFDGQAAYLITGNAYDVLNNFEKYKSDDSSGFTLNFGEDTSIASNDIFYDNKYWSFDTIWHLTNKGGSLVGEDGRLVNELSLNTNVVPTLSEGTYSATVPISILPDFVDKSKISVMVETYNEGWGTKPLANAVKINEDSGTIELSWSGDEIVEGLIASGGSQSYKDYNYLGFYVTYESTASGSAEQKVINEYFLIHK